MINITVYNDEIKDSKVTKELSTYLLRKGHKITTNTQFVNGAKCELVLGIAIATLVVNSYPIIKDLQNWVRPKRYSISMTDGNTMGTINDLTEKEYIELLEKLDKKLVKIEIS